MKNFADVAPRPGGFYWLKDPEILDLISWLFGSTLSPQDLNGRPTLLRRHKLHHKLTFRFCPPKF